MGGPWRIKVGEEQTTAVFEPASRNGHGTLFILAHGAGGHRDDRGMLALSAEFRSRGMDVVRFNFLYREKPSARPDRMPLLEDCMASVIEHARREITPKLLVIGGRSMGGRVASMLAADGFACDGLLLLAYPLHPAGKPEKLRDAHLEQIRVPVLCLNGTRDALCRRELMEQVSRRLSGVWTMHWLEAADHGFHVTKASGLSDKDVLQQIGEVSSAWESGLRKRC